jgi:Metallo-beta-lactamase superfamily
VLSPDGGFGWSNVRLVPGGGCTLLIDTLFDLALTAEVLAAMDSITPEHPLTDVVNTHANGDHCFGNQLVSGVSRRSCPIGHSVDISDGIWTRSMRSHNSCCCLSSCSEDRYDSPVYSDKTSACRRGFSNSAAWRVPKPLRDKWRFPWWHRGSRPIREA